MKSKFELSVDIDAPKQIVWQMLVDEKFTQRWYQKFKPDIFIKTDWRRGSKVSFTDPQGDGLIGTIIISDECRELCLQYDGIVIAGREDLNSEQAKTVKGYKERFVLKQLEDHTLLTLQVDVEHTKSAVVGSMWTEAIAEIRKLAESVAKFSSADQSKN